MAVGKELFKLFGLIGMQGVEAVEKDIKGIERQVRKTQKEIDRFGRRVSDVGKVLSKALTLPMAAIGAAAFKMRADFDQALTASTAIMGNLSTAMRKDLKNAAIEVSKVTSFSAKQAAEAYYFLASAGLDAAQSIAALPQVARFAQAGNFDLAQATDLLTDAQSALGLSSKDTAQNMANMSRVSDVLVKANTLANASVAQFSESLTNKAGAALRQLDKDIEEGIAVLAVFADQGLKGAASGEALNIVMRDLQRASLKNEEAFKKANVSVFDGNGKMRNMADIIGDLERLLSGMSDKQRRATLSMLGFQDKSISATMALLGTSNAIKKYEDGVRSAAGTTDEIAKKQLDTFWKKLGLLKDRLIAVGLTTDTLAGVGNSVLLPVLEKLVRLAEKINSWFNGLSASMQKTVKGFLLLAAGIGPAVFILGKLIVIGKFLIPILVSLVTGTFSLSGAMTALSKSVFGVTLVIAALAAIGWYWYSQWDTMSVQLAALWAKIKTFILGGVNDIAQGLTDGILKIIDLLDNVSNFIPGMSDKLKAARVDILKFKAALYGDLASQQAYTNELNSQAGATASFSDNLKKAVEDGKNLIGIKDADIAKTQQQTAAEAAKKEAALSGIEAEKKAATDLLRFKQDIEKQIDQITLDRMALLLLEREKALEEAEKLGADKFEILRLYANKIADLEDQQRKEAAAKDKQVLKDRLNDTTKIGNKINSIMGKFADNRLKRLDIEEQKKIEAIKHSQLTEEQKEAAIQKIQADTEKKRRKMERERAIREKIAALFNIAINTASAIVEALPNIPLAIAVGALGVAEGVAVATEPLPFFEGGLVKGSQQGVNAIVGERNQDEIIFPLEAGVGMLIDGLIERLGEIEIPYLGAPALAAPAGPATTINLNIGTFIGDERGLKELERRLDTIRIAENQRKGI